MSSLPIQNNTNFGIGPDDETQNIFNIQPVWPFSIGEDWNLITRTILPVVSQPNVLTGGEGRINGLGDTTFTGFFSPKDSPSSPGASDQYFLFQPLQMIHWAQTSGALELRWCCWQCRESGLLDHCSATFGPLPVLAIRM
jgi:hypothetical protein